MIKDFFKASYEERKADVKEAIDNSFIGLLFCRDSASTDWQVVGYSENGAETALLEVLDYANSVATKAVEEVLSW